MLNLENKTPAERAEIKSREIAKNQINIFSKKDLEVEIVGATKVIKIGENYGVELFAKAWKNKKQLGFGKDGSVEIERFQIFNPPVLVDDPNGEIIREWIDPITQEKKQRTLREDTEEALRQTLCSVINTVGKESQPIIKGKIGNTTTTYYPASGYSGFMNSGWQTSWADARNNGGAGISENTNLEPGYWRYNFPPIKDFIQRAYIIVDTSGIPDTDTIDSATAYLYAESVDNAENDGYDYITPVSGTFVDIDDPVAGDFDGFDTTKLSDTDRDLGSMVTDAYTTWALNATGLAEISKTGKTLIGFREGHDIDNNGPTSATGGWTNRMYAYGIDEAGTTKDPKLVVTYSAAGTPVTVTPSAQVVTATVPSYTVKKGITVTPSVQTVTSSLPARTISTGLSLTASILTATFSVPTYTIVMTVFPSVQTATFSIPTYTVHFSSVISASVQVTTFSVPTYSVTVDSKKYTREAKVSLPTDNTDLSTVYSVAEKSDVDSDDGVRVGLTGSGYLLHQFKFTHGNSTDDIELTWNGQSSKAPAVNLVKLQIYNHNTPAWEDVDSNNAAAVDTDFTLNGHITTNVANYYNGSDQISARVYQQS